MRTYGMGYREVMEMPTRAFWAVSGFVDRIRADEAVLDLDLSVRAQDPGLAKEMQEHLQKIAPAPVKLTVEAMIEASAVRDEQGFEELKALAG